MTLEQLQEILATIRRDAAAKQREDYGNGMAYACLLIEVEAIKLESKKGETNANASA